MTFPREGYAPQKWSNENRQPKQSSEEGKVSNNKTTKSADPAAMVGFVQRWEVLQQKIFRVKYNHSGRLSLLAVIVIITLFIVSQIWYYNELMI